MMCVMGGGCDGRARMCSPVFHVNADLPLTPTRCCHLKHTRLVKSLLIHTQPPFVYQPVHSNERLRGDADRSPTPRERVRPYRAYNPNTYIGEPILLQKLKETQRTFKG